MMKTFGKSKGKKYHGRKIEINTYDFDEMRILVEGNITDRTFTEYPSLLTGRKKMPGIKNQISVHLLVNKTTLEIEDVDIKMPVFPLEQCPEVLALMDPIRGLIISGEFPSKIKALLGGTKGCMHITDLLSAMALSTIQGLMYYIRSEALMSNAEIVKFFVDSCWPLRSEGPLMKFSKEKRGANRK